MIWAVELCSLGASIIRVVESAKQVNFICPLFLSVFCFCPEDGGIMSPQRVDLPPNCTALTSQETVHFNFVSFAEVETETGLGMLRQTNRARPGCLGTRVELVLLSLRPQHKLEYYLNHQGRGGKNRNSFLLTSSVRPVHFVCTLSVGQDETWCGGQT